jgi:dihydroxyacetone kinase
MQKLLNSPSAFVDEMLDGIAAAHASELRLLDEGRAIVRITAPVAGKVAIATGGGSGHLPVFMGYVGDGLADGAAIGDVFASPSAETMLSVTRAIDGGSGVLYLYGNYGGDILNFDLAADLARDEGIEVETVLAHDDVASAPKGDELRRRGIAGIFLLYKVAGARASQGASLAEVKETVLKASGDLRTMGVALSPCTIPAAGRPTFELPLGEMEIGMGIHGEPGVRRGKLEQADVVASELMTAILDDLEAARGDRVTVLVNGLGATPKEELYILYRTVDRVLRDREIDVHRVYVGEYATSLEMAGASISVMRVDDDLAALVDAPAASPFFVQR